MRIGRARTEVASALSLSLAEPALITTVAHDKAPTALGAWAEAFF